MNLIKVITTQVYGYDGSEFESTSYIISNECMVNDTPYSQEDVQDEDEIYLEYNKYIDLGNITEDEEDILNKFGII